MTIYGGVGRRVNNTQKKRQAFKVSYIPRGTVEIKTQVPVDEIIEANSQYEAWAKAFRKFEKKYPVKDFQYFDLDIRLLRETLSE